MQKPMIHKLSSTFVEKVWGVDRLPPPFPHPSTERIGEVWFEPSRELDQLLVKHIFASERLSVQAHPDDEQAQSMGLGKNGKSECWVILDAEPGATIAVGFKEKISPHAMREAALNGSIVEQLVWHEVQSRDVFYIPAGTVHAIGGGVSLIEVQQNSDVTFRLFDYGRPRELHLDQAMEVANTGRYPSEYHERMEDDAGVLVDGPHFRLSYWRTDGSARLPEFDEGPALFIPFSGEITIGEETLALGECAIAPDPASLSLQGECILLMAQTIPQS